MSTGPVISWTLLLVLHVLCDSSNGNTIPRDHSVVVTSLGHTSLDPDVWVIPFDIRPDAVLTFNTSDGVTTIKANPFVKPVSCAVDFGRRHGYVYDSLSTVLTRLTSFSWQTAFKDMSVETVHSGLSRSSVRLALDWVSNNIYWADPHFRWIVVQSLDKDETYYKILINDELDDPLGIAVAPGHDYLFWGDGGSTPRIERSSLVGNNRRAIVTEGIAHPAAITVDMDLDKIVWVDTVRDSIETANFDGGERTIIRRMSHTTFYDVAVFENLILATDSTQGRMYYMDKVAGGPSHLSQTSGAHFAGLSIMSDGKQPSITNQCENALCTDLCVSKPGGYDCLCREGYNLAADDQTCTENEGWLHRALVYATSNKICAYDVRVVNTDAHTQQETCFYTSGTDINHIAIDAHDRKVIFADGSVIRSLNIDTNTGATTLWSATQTITGLAFDWRDKNVYWSQGTNTGKILVGSQQTLDVYTLAETNVHQPQHLTILPIHNKLLWSAFNPATGAYVIETSKLDGSEREIILETGTSGSSDIAVDASKNKLYYIVGINVKVSDLDGGNIETASSWLSIINPLQCLVYKKHVLVYDGANVHASVTSSPTDVLSDFPMSDMTDFDILDYTSQPSQHGPCDVQNGGCDHICLPIGLNTRLCQCDYGFQLDTDRATCSSVPLTDNFLMVGDWTHDKVYQVSLEDDTIRAIDSQLIKDPTAIVCNVAGGELIWGDSNLRQMQSVKLDGSAYRILANVDTFSSYPDRAVIDYNTGNVYYTAVSADQFFGFGFAGIGVIRPNGAHAKLVSYGSMPRAIVLDAGQGLLFWTDHGTNTHALLKANIDGTYMRILNNQFTWPNGLAIDSSVGLLYVADGSTNTIHRCDYDGQCAQFYEDEDAHLMDIQIDGEFLFYTAWNKPWITKLRKATGEVVSRLANNAELGRLDAMCVYNSTSANVPATTRAPPTEPTTTPPTTPSPPPITPSPPPITPPPITPSPPPITPSPPPITPSPPPITPSPPPITPSPPPITPSPPTPSPSSPRTTITTPVSKEAPTTDTPPSSGPPMALIGGAAGGTVILIVVVVVLFFVCKSRRGRAPGNDPQYEQPFARDNTGFDKSRVYSDPSHLLGRAPPKPPVDDTDVVYDTIPGDEELKIKVDIAGQKVRASNTYVSQVPGRRNVPSREVLSQLTMAPPPPQNGMGDPYYITPSDPGAAPYSDYEFPSTQSYS